MAGEFVVTRNGRDTFHDEASLRAQAERGLLAPGDLVYHPLLGRWLYAREVEEIRPTLEQATALGRPVAALVPVRRGESNPWAVAGFSLGLAGMVPFLGILSSLLGLYFSGRGLREAMVTGRGQGLAVVGLVLSVIFLLPAMACGLLLVSR